MRVRSFHKYISISTEILSVILILLLFLFILQMLALEIESNIISSESSGVRERREITEREKQLNRIANSEKEFLPDGTMHIIFNYEKIGQDDTPYICIYDVNNNLVWQGKHGEQIPYEYLEWEPFFRTLGEFNDELKALEIVSPMLSQTLDVNVSLEGPFKEIWRYEPSKGYFKGYKVSSEGGTFTRNAIGYFGSNGFAGTRSQVKPFDKFRDFEDWVTREPYESELLWLTDYKVYTIDFENRKVKVFLENPGDKLKKIYSGGDLQNRSERPEKETKIRYQPYIDFVSENKNHNLFFGEPFQKVTFSEPENLRGTPWSVALSVMENDIFLKRRITKPTPPFPFEELSWARYQWYEEYYRREHIDGIELYKIGNGGELRLVERFQWTVPARIAEEDTVLGSKIKPYVTAFSPLLYGLLRQYYKEKLWNLLYYSEGQVAVLWQATAFVIKETGPSSILLNLFLSIVMMVFAFWHGWIRRTSWVKLIFWIVLVGLFNLVGLLTYLALNHTTVIKCPVCGQSRGLGRVDCVRCGADLPEPKRRDVDLIFSS